MNLDFKCFPEQHEFVEAVERYAAAVCGIGGGKTEGGAIKTFVYCMEHKGCLGMVTAPTFRMLEDATIRTLMHVIPDKLYTYHKGEMRMEFVNGSEILLRSTDDPERLRGPNLHFVWMDEAARSPADSFKILQGRIRAPGFPNRLWITTTPKGFNWVYQEFAAQTRDDYRMYTWPTYRNIYLPSDYARSLRSDYPGNFGLQELEAQFVITEGLAFFDSDALANMLKNDAEDPIEVRDGAIEIFRKPINNAKYVGGSDVSWGDTGAYSDFTLADYQTGAEVATIHGRIPEPEFAKQIFDLSHEYNDAFCGIEDNGEGINVVNRCIELGMGARMYFTPSTPFKYADIRAPRVSKKPGWHTDLNTRPVMLSEFAEAIKFRAYIPRSRRALGEMLSFIRNDKGRAEHSPGARDDGVISRAILWQMRKHATFNTTSVGRGPVRMARRY